MRFQMEKLAENTVGDDNVLVYQSADSIILAVWR